MKKRKNKVGLPPGTVVYTGKKFDLPIKINYTEYTPESIKNEVFDSTHNFKLYESNESIIQWYDLRGLHDTNLIQKIAITFGVHPLVAEDITDVHKRPEYTEYKSGHFMSLKKFHYDKEKKEILPQSLSIYFGKGFVLSFQENEDDVFELIRERLLQTKGKIREKKADYLFYALIDYIVDGYYLTIEDLEEELDIIENIINTDVEKIDKNDLYTLKINLIKLRKSVTPLREALSQFVRSDSLLIEERTNAYIRDAYDHTIHIVESIDTHRDVLSGLQDLYISEISLKMNRIMQFLTIVTAIFVPLSFLTGLYGMNFEYIPELTYRNGYFVLWGVMLLITIGAVYYFKKKKWF